MTHSKITGHRWLCMALGVAAVTVLSGCYDDAVTDVTGDVPALNVSLGPGAAVLPGGELGLTALIADFDLSLPDAFDRSDAPLENYTEQETAAGTTMGLEVLPGIEGSNVDPRLPVPTHDAAVPGDFFGLYNPVFAGQGGAAWDLFGEIGGLEPNQTYTVVLARMALDVRGELDHSQVLLGQAVEEPDSLYFLGGSEAGYPGVTCNFTALSPVTASTNPVALGVFGTGGGGDGTIDCVPAAFEDSPWWRSAESTTPPGAADSIPFGINSPDGELVPGMFNYVLLYEGEIDPANPVPDGSPAVRIQVGPDIDSDGNVIENAFAPFPSGITDLDNFGSLPGGADAFAAPAELDLTLSGLPELGSGATYGVYLQNTEANSYALASSFDSPGPTEMFQTTLDMESTGLDLSEYNQVVVSIESGSPGETPSDDRFLVREYFSPMLDLSEGQFTFGDAAATPVEGFAIEGAGTATFIRDSLLVQLRRLDEPPAGFHYQSYLLDGTPDDFDSEVRLNTIELDDLGNGVDRIGEDEVGSFANYNTYVVALEPDVAPGLTPAFIQVSEDYVDQFGEFFQEPDDGENGET